MDSDLIKQVIINLVTNAIKFTNDGGEISLLIDYIKEEDSFKFLIKDNGIGIKKEDIDKLFQPFVQVENKFQKKVSGTGLGLVICKKIIEEFHGGKISVWSECNKGSTFSFTIPIKKQHILFKEIDNKNEYAKRLLIVEDDENFQKILIDKLKEQFNITMTNSIQKAKELVESKNYDFAVFDFFLIDGTSSEILNFMHQKHIKLQTLVLSAEEDIKILSSVDHNMNFIGVYNKSNLEFFYKDLYSLL